MKSDIKKHELLKILSHQRQLKHTPLGLINEEILELLKINHDYLDFISGELYGNEEIQFFENPQYKKGLCCTRKGVLSYSSRKYIRRQREDTWNEVKNWVQTLIPVLSLLIAILALTSNFSFNSNESREHERSGNKLFEQKTHIETQVAKDTLNSKLND